MDHRDRVGCDGPTEAGWAAGPSRTQRVRSEPTRGRYPLRFFPAIVTLVRSFDLFGPGVSPVRKEVVVSSAAGREAQGSV